MKVGSIVLCIDDKFTPKQLTNIKNLPVKDEYYALRDIIEYQNPKRIGVRLEEIFNPEIMVGEVLHECTFNINRFVELKIPPLIKLEIENLTSIEIEIW